MSDETEQTPRAKRWVKPLLVVSLAFNLAVAGLVAGAAWRHDGGEGGNKGRGSQLGAYGLPYMKALPRESRRAIFAQIKKSGDQALPDRATRRAHFEAVLGALQMSPFDETALRAALAVQASTTVQVQERVQSAWMSVVAAMSDAERMAYAADVKNTLKRGPQRK